MAVLLPSDPAPASVEMIMRRFGNDLTPPGGGAAMRIRRLGDRFSQSVRMPPLDYADQARKWIARLLRGANETVLMPVYQPGLEIGNPGAPRVNGAGQLGMTLNLDGFTPGYLMREGQFFSLVVSGQRFLYSCTADTAANASGAMALPFEPMLRRQPADNDVVEVAQPMIEGFVEGRETTWTVEAAFNVGLDFKIDERE